MINCSIKSSESIILQTEHDIQEKIFKNISRKFWTIIIEDISSNQNQTYDWSSSSKRCYHNESQMIIKKQNNWFKIFSTKWKRRWKKMIENDLIKILSRRTLSQRLLILSIDIKKRKYVYVQMKLKNSDSFNFRSEIFNSNENFV
jgi:hypothetical protein